MESNQIESEVDTLTKLFHSTLSSLSDEAKQIQQLTSLSKILHSSSSSSPTPTPMHQDIENRNPNINDTKNGANDPVKQFTITIMDQLEFLSNNISQMETKAATIQQVINEEKQALEAIQKTRNAAIKQKEMIQNVWNELERQNVMDTLPGNDLFRKGYRINTISMMEDQKTRQEEIKRFMSSHSIARRGRDLTVKTSYLSSKAERVFPSTSNSQETSKTPTSKSDKDVFNEDSILLEPISPSEYQSISKTLLGRISLTDLNSALVEIHQLVVQKYKQLQSPVRRNQDSIRTKDRFLSSINHDVFEDGLPFVTEEELRKECAFFVMEATARGILRVLRSMNRIKHVSCRQLQIRYVWLHVSKEEQNK